MPFSLELAQKGLNSAVSACNCRFSFFLAPQLFIMIFVNYIIRFDLLWLWCYSSCCYMLSHTIIAKL